MYLNISISIHLNISISIHIYKYFHLNSCVWCFDKRCWPPPPHSVASLGVSFINIIKVVTIIQICQAVPKAIYQLCLSAGSPEVSLGSRLTSSRASSSHSPSQSRQSSISSLSLSSPSSSAPTSLLVIH